MTDIAIGRGERSKKRNTDHDTAHGAVADHIAAEASGGCVAEIRVIEQHAGVEQQEDCRQPMVSEPFHHWCAGRFEGWVMAIVIMRARSMCELSCAND